MEMRRCGLAAQWAAVTLGALAVALTGCGVDELHGEADAASRAPSRLPYAPQPGWSSADAEAHSLGAALADINGDGFKDLIVANGNDLAENPVTVFYNDGRGRFPTTPSWSSNDEDHHTGVAVGDIDLDGWVDVAITVAPAPENTAAEGYAKVYFNRGGALEPSPSYRTEDRYRSTGGALGDYDGDGDLDLAVAVVFEEGRAPGRVRIYGNEGGRLSPSPTWQSDTPMTSFNMKFADIDGDGLLDMAVAAPSLPIYRARLDPNGSVTLPAAPYWTARAEDGLPFFVDVGIVGGSPRLVTSYNDFWDPPSEPPPGGWPETENTPCAPGLGSLSRLMVYAPFVDEAPIWSAESVGWGSGVLLADVSGDDVLDLLATRWGPAVLGMGAPLEIYLGGAGVFGAKPAWVSRTCTVGETILVADLSRDSLEEASISLSIERPRAVVTLLHQVTEGIVEVRRNGVALGRGEYVVVPGGNWVSFGQRLLPGDQVTVRYLVSSQPDIVLTSTFAPNHVFYRRSSR
ncbi:FG-GAP repeat domain-containing protein [Polyangium spumosum]|uniref:VCBS repeat-containing protein n=1 Tax=Polyangium spumosum TaxID=889282 RepID=A0A6N7PU42_9BACT|nr:VCBS repeat-containing protein [Polyangium spumosum]MRG95439.1 hypothetical protein [Polyangium spumosum]